MYNVYPCHPVDDIWSFYLYFNSTWYRHVRLKHHSHTGKNTVSYTYWRVHRIVDFKQHGESHTYTIFQATVLPSGTATSEPRSWRDVLCEDRPPKTTTRAADEISNIAFAVQQPQTAQVSMIKNNRNNNSRIDGITIIKLCVGAHADNCSHGASIRDAKRIVMVGVIFTGTKTSGKRWRPSQSETKTNCGTIMKRTWRCWIKRSWAPNNTTYPSPDTWLAGLPTFKWLRMSKNFISVNKIMIYKIAYVYILYTFMRHVHLVKPLVSWSGCPLHEMYPFSENYVFLHSIDIFSIFL